MNSRPHWLVPEVIQTSGMDCGPASLKAMLEGFGIPVSYGRLREACQTDVDGTSISTMEEVATQLGLVAEEIMLPTDHLLLPASEALPAIVVIRLPSGFTHFVVVWSVVGPLVQVMDPATGRRWMRREELLAMLYRHRMAVPAEAWREFAGGESFQDGLRARMQRLKLPSQEDLLAEATWDPTWEGLGTLDAALRLVQSVVDADGLRPGAEAEAAVVRMQGTPKEIPTMFWSVLDTEPDEDGGEQLVMTGAVMVRAVERGEADLSALSPELQAALTEAPPQPLRTLLDQLRADGLLVPSALAGALAVSAGTLLIEAILMRGLLEAGPLLGLSGQRSTAIAALGALIALGMLLELSVVRGALSAGRRLEGQLRQAFLAKIPRLPDRYFQSRLISDMAERSHSAHLLRRVPMLGMTALQGALLLALTTAAITWLDPATGPFALAAAVMSVVLPLVFHPLLSEQDLKVRSQLGALSRFYLDALMGLSPIRAHGAERAVRREHESLLVEWGRAGLALQRSAVLIEGLIALAGFGMAVMLVSVHALNSGDSGAGLLLLYWALSLPAHGATVAVASRQYPSMRSVTLRLMEPLLAPESPIPPTAADPAEAEAGGVSIASDGLWVVAGGNPILRGLTFDIPAGSHVAIVGPSGSGKSSLVGLLLGWHRPIAGQLSVDGEALDLGRLPALRQQTAWLDPEVRLWNRSLLANLRYGAPVDAEAADRVLADASLMGVLARLPDGLQSPLGEGGGLVSGGEGQRVRFARALSRGPVRLAILDEPFRGLDRKARRTLLTAARRRWADATLLCVTHDVGQTLDFERVLVVAQGQIIEDGDPRSLRAQPDSKYRALLEAEERVQKTLWRGAGWRRLWMDRGTLSERSDDSDEGTA